jgi:hypothetical protein
MLEKGYAFVKIEFLAVVVIPDLDAIGFCHFGHLIELMRNLDRLSLVAEGCSCPDNGFAAESSHRFDNFL